MLNSEVWKGGVPLLLWDLFECRQNAEPYIRDGNGTRRRTEQG